MTDHQGQTEAQEQAQEMIQSILARSATDPEFRQQLLADPRGALAAHSGGAVRDDLDLRFVENQADLTIVLPDPVDPDAELAEEDLEAVAGGVTPWLLVAPMAWGLGKLVDAAFSRESEC